VHNRPLTSGERVILNERMTHSQVRLAYVALGSAFAALGALVLLNVASAWRVGEVFLWGASMYALMDFLVAYGLFNRERWVPHAFLLNLIGLAIMFGASILFTEGAANLTFYGVALGINALLAAFLYRTASRGRGDLLGEKAGMAFVALWAVMFCYSIAGNLS
jgi:hypothetical protein